MEKSKPFVDSFPREIIGFSHLQLVYPRSSSKSQSEKQDATLQLRFEFGRVILGEGGHLRYTKRSIQDYIHCPQQLWGVTNSYIG